MTVPAHLFIIKADITYRQLDYWTRTGLITPVPRDISQRGIERDYPDSQVQIARIMSRLSDAGVNIRVARRMAGDLIRTGHAGLGPGLSVVLDEAGIEATG